MWQPARPAFSNSPIVRATFSAPPKPVSASTIAGIVTALATYPASLTTSVIVSNPMSGTPAVAFAIPAPLMYTASKPARSTCRAIAAFGTPGNRMQLCAINSRSLLLLLMLVLVIDSLLHHARPQQFIDALRLIQFPDNLDDLLASFLAKDGLNERVKLSFHLRIFQRILRVPQRIIDASGHPPAIREINMHNVGDRV